MAGAATKEPHPLTAESIGDFLLHEQDAGASAACLRQRRTHVMALLQWLPEPKHLTYDLLRAWRQSLQDRGCSQATVANYIKNVNRYLDFAGRPDLRFNKGRQKDLTGQEYGYLTAIEPTGEKHRKDLVWRCRCRCGNEVHLPATRLLTGNTSSCGCVQVANLQAANQYIAHTSLRSALEERVESPRAASGYTGVCPKGGKWLAYITYRGKQYSLGCYTKIEDAVKARARAKELVREDAAKLQALYLQQHQNDPPRPTRKKGGRA